MEVEREAGPGAASDAIEIILARVEEDLHELVRLARRQDEWLEILVRQGR